MSSLDSILIGGYRRAATMLLASSADSDVRRSSITLTFHSLVEQQIAQIKDRAVFAACA